MATYKNMHEHPKPETKDNFVAAGYADNDFTLAVGPIRIKLTKEEKERTLKTWEQLEAGINPETGEKF